MIDLYMNNILRLLRVNFKIVVGELGILALCIFRDWRGGGVRGFLMLGCKCRGVCLVIFRLYHLLLVACHLEMSLKLLKFTI